MRGRRKNKAITHIDTHRWIISYADFITLLFAFFVVMYAISSVNVSKYKTLAKGMNTAFTAKSEKKAYVANAEKNNMDTAIESPLTDKSQFDSLIQALSQLEDSDYHMNPKDGWVELDISAGALFDSGSADLMPLATIKLMKIASAIKDFNYPIAIEGYTDNVPINTDQFPSNWELSSARAGAVARTLVNFGVAQSRISVTGYGEQYPVDDNGTEDGRSHNRRVNLIIAKDKTVPRLLDPAIGAPVVKQTVPADSQQPEVKTKSQEGVSTSPVQAVPTDKDIKEAP